MKKPDVARHFITARDKLGQDCPRLGIRWHGFDIGPALIDGMGGVPRLCRQNRAPASRYGGMRSRQASGKQAHLGWVEMDVVGRQVPATVDDQGAGIPPDQLEKVVEGFRRATQTGWLAREPAPIVQAP